MENRNPIPKAVSETDPSVTGSSSSKEAEKTIPFLRRLVDMLRENEEIVSFYPGVETSDKRLLGKIVVHDRARVESEILPRYFSHSSFASLRRQLNYFAFTRVGKGRQRGATYCNEAVVVMDDILHLKRRPNGSTANIAEVNQHLVEVKPTAGSSTDAVEHKFLLYNHQLQASSNLHSTIRKAVVPFVHLPRSKRPVDSLLTTQHRSKKIRRSKSDSPPIISPLSTSPVHSDDEWESETQTREHAKRIVLDLTGPPVQAPAIDGSTAWRPNQMQFVHGAGVSYDEEEDILAGCSALLSFAQSGVH